MGSVLGIAVELIIRYTWDMAIYCFITNEGKIVERAFPMGACPYSVEVDGIEAVRCRAAEGVSGYVKGSKTPVKRGHGKWPMEPCTASGVQPDQAQELRDLYKKNNLNIEVTPSGDPIYESAKQRKKALKLRGFVDKASYC